MMTGKATSYMLDRLPSLNVHLLERRITCMTVGAIVEAIHTACVTGSKMTVAHYNVHSFNLSMQLPWFYNFLQTAEIAHCDSTGILKAIRFMGHNLPIQYRVSYTVLMPKLLEHCNQQGLSVYLLGAKPEYLEAALNNLKTQYPNIRFGGHHGYFDKDNPQENEAVIEQINQFKPHILVVGMGMPVQENWIRWHRHNLDVNVIMPGGAIIDRLAGIVSDCPAFISNVGLEWLYRLLSEPKRLAARYLLGNPAFVLHMLLGKLYAPLKVQQVPRGNVESLAGNDAQMMPKEAGDSRTKRIGQYLVEAGLVSRSHIETALAEQQVNGRRLGEILVQSGKLKQQTVEYLMENIIVPDRASASAAVLYAQRLPLLQE